MPKCERKLTFKFTNDGTSQSLGYFPKNNQEYEAEKDTTFEVRIRILEVYKIDPNNPDEFEFENDEQVPIDK